jgi:hypothetical protein
MAENTSRPCSSVPSRYGRDARIDQFELRGIERILHREQRGEDRQQKKQEGNDGRDHGEAGTAERIEDVAVDRAPEPAHRSGRRATAISGGVGCKRGESFGHANLSFRSRG